MMMLPLAELSPAAAAAAADPSLAAAAAELSPAAAAAAADPSLAAAARTIACHCRAAADPSLAAADAAEDAKACSKDTLAPIIAVIITTAKITGILVFI